MDELPYSVIIPVYNRPAEVKELLESLAEQTFRDFEVLVIEDGSTLGCEEIVMDFRDRLNVQYYFKENSGQGFTRNYGFEKANGNYLIVFDSDCIVPNNYMEVVHRYLQANRVDAFGGPDRAMDSFTPIQRAISYSMTSFFTTGGIRGGEKRLGTFHPRSFNMGISKEVFQKTGGYMITRMAEDIEFSLRIIANGFKTALIKEAFVYHKRRTTLKAFFKQLHFFGRGRINLSRYFPGEIKWVHWFPAIFILLFVLQFFLLLLDTRLFLFAASGFVLYFLLIFLDSLGKNKSTWVALLSIATAFTQLAAYGIGFLTELFKPSKSTT